LVLMKAVLPLCGSDNGKLQRNIRWLVTPVLTVVGGRIGLDPVRALEPDDPAPVRQAPQGFRIAAATVDGSAAHIHDRSDVQVPDVFQMPRTVIDEPSGHHAAHVGDGDEPRTAVKNDQSRQAPDSPA
jgi:hypothetical protein